MNTQPNFWRDEGDTPVLEVGDIHKTLSLKDGMLSGKLTFQDESAGFVWNKIGNRKYLLIDIDGKRIKAYVNEMVLMCDEWGVETTVCFTEVP